MHIEGHKKQCDWHKRASPCLNVCVDLGDRQSGRGAFSAHTAFLFAWLDLLHTHIQRTHAHSVTPHPAKPALTVLSHHIWAVLTGDATGQSTATCAKALQLLCPTSPCNFPPVHFFLNCLFSPCSGMILVLMKGKDTVYLHRQPHRSKNQYSAGSFFQRADNSNN